MYRPVYDIRDLRSRGLPWLVGALVLVIVLLLGCILFLVVDGYIFKDAPPAATPCDMTGLNYSFEFSTKEDTGLNFSSRPILRTTSSTTAPSTIPHTTTTSTTPPTTLLQNNGNKIITEIPKVRIRRFRTAMVLSESDVCSDIGRDIFLIGGNAVEAAIAASICVGAVHPHSTGLGSSSIILIHFEGTTHFINGISSSPHSVSELTYAGNPDLQNTGYSSIAIPGHLSALWTAYRQFGSSRIPWSGLVMPTVNLLNAGIPVSAELAENIEHNSESIQRDQTLSDLFDLEIGRVRRNPVLAETLRRIGSSRDPMQLFYRGDMANSLVAELRNKGALLTKLDFVNYVAKLEEPIRIQCHGGILFVPRPPSNGAAIGALLKAQLAGDAISDSELNTAMKHLTKEIGDPASSIETVIKALDLQYLKAPGDTDDYVDSKSFTARHDNIKSTIHTISSNMEVSIISSLGSSFGSLRRSEKLGFFWNNAMQSFTDGVNKVEGAKRPRTMMAPMLFEGNQGSLYLLDLQPSESTAFSAVADVFNKKNPMTPNSTLHLLSREGDSLNLWCFSDTCDNVSGY